MKFRWDRKYLYWGTTAFVTACCILVFYWVIGDWDNVTQKVTKFFTAISPVIYALVFSFLLAPICNWLEINAFLPLGKKIHKESSKKAKKFARFFSVTGALICGILIIGVILYLILPKTYESIKGIVTMMPDYLNQFIKSFDKLTQSKSAIWADLSSVLNSVYNNIGKWLNDTIMPNMGTLITGVSSGVVSVFRVILNSVIGLIITAYLLYNKEYFIAQMKKIIFCLFSRKTSNALLQTGNLTYQMFGNYISARIIDSFIIGILCYIGMLILKIPEAELISVIVGVTNIIPFFGPFIGAIPSALLLLLENPIKCLIFIIFILCLQQFDGNILGPHLLGNSTGLDKFWVMLALLIGAMYGFIGMICAVPFFAVIYTILRTIANNRLQKIDLPIDTKEYMNLKYIDEKTGERIHTEPQSPAKSTKRKKKPKKNDK